VIEIQSNTVEITFRFSEIKVGVKDGCWKLYRIWITAHLGVIFGYCRLITDLSLYLCNSVEMLMLPVVLSRIDTYVSERAHVQATMPILILELNLKRSRMDHRKLLLSNLALFTNVCIAIFTLPTSQLTRPARAHIQLDL